jgi:uncharacterized membrane protein YfcA
LEFDFFKLEFYNLETRSILLCIASFVAGFIDAIVGGGGLVQTPAVLILLPTQSEATIIGTLKFQDLVEQTYHYFKKSNR